jgi:hypothetical protein
VQAPTSLSLKARSKQTAFRRRRKRAKVESLHQRAVPSGNESLKTRSDRQERYEPSPPVPPARHTRLLLRGRPHQRTPTQRHRTRGRLSPSAPSACLWNDLWRNSARPTTCWRTRCPRWRRSRSPRSFRTSELAPLRTLDFGPTPVRWRVDLASFNELAGEVAEGMGAAVLHRQASRAWQAVGEERRRKSRKNGTLVGANVACLCRTFAKSPHPEPAENRGVAGSSPALAINRRSPQSR